MEQASVSSITQSKETAKKIFPNIMNGSNTKRKHGESKGAKDAKLLLPKNKKRALKHERQSHRRHYDDVTRAKALWNKLRVKTNSKNETKEIMAELMDLLTGEFQES